MLASAVVMHGGLHADRGSAGDSGPSQLGEVYLSLHYLYSWALLAPVVKPSVVSPWWL